MKSQSNPKARTAKSQGTQSERRPVDPKQGRKQDRERDQADKRKHREERTRREWERLKKDRGRTYTPWLLIRSIPWDYGLRPLPNGTAFWLSPDISVESSDPFGRGVAGEENFLHARIFNLGKAVAVPTRVDFYWADPSVGLGAEHMNLIGTEWVEVPAHSARDVRCNTPWIPTFLNGGHECLKVNCNNALLDPIKFPFEPWLDRHAGQRNITVLDCPPGGAIKFSLNINNIFNKAMRLQLHLKVEHLQVDRHAAERLTPRALLERVLAFGQPPRPTAKELLTRFGDRHPDGLSARAAAHLSGEGQIAGDRTVRRVKDAERSSASVRHQWDHESRRFLPIANRDAANRDKLAGLAASASAQPESPMLLLETAEFEGLEQRRLKLELGVPANAAPGEFLVAHVQQRIGTAVIGGYTIVIAIGR